MQRQMSFVVIFKGAPALSPIGALDSNIYRFRHMPSVMSSRR